MGGCVVQWDLTGYSYPSACCPGHVDESCSRLHPVVFHLKILDFICHLVWQRTFKPLPPFRFLVLSWSRSSPHFVSWRSNWWRSDQKVCLWSPKPSNLGRKASVLSRLQVATNEILLNPRLKMACKYGKKIQIWHQWVQCSWDIGISDIMVKARLTWSWVRFFYVDGTSDANLPPRTPQ